MYEDDVHLTYEDEYGDWYIHLEPMDKLIHETVVQTDAQVLVDYNAQGQIVGIEILGIKR